MKKVIITADSSADLDYLFEKRSIPVLPLIVNLGDEGHFDGVDITPDHIYKYVEETGNLPRTAANNPDNMRSFFKKYIDDDYDIVHINISSELSMMHNNCRLVAQEFEGRIFVIDSRSLSTGTGLLALYAADLRDEGLGAQEIYEKTLARVPYVQASFVIDKLKFLYKGGRCSGVAMFAASVLKIKPSIIVKDGKMIVGKKYLGSLNHSIDKYVGDITEDYKTPDLTRVFITHSSTEPEIIEKVRQMVKAKFNFKEVLITVAGSTITSHCGKGALGILYLNDGK